MTILLWCGWDRGRPQTEWGEIEEPSLPKYRWHFPVAMNAGQIEARGWWWWWWWWCDRAGENSEQEEEEGEREKNYSTVSCPTSESMIKCICSIWLIALSCGKYAMNGPHFHLVDITQMTFNDRIIPMISEWFFIELSKGHRWLSCVREGDGANGVDIDWDWFLDCVQWLN